MAIVISGPDPDDPSASIVYEQAIPAAVWGPIEHGYGRRPPAVTLFSTDYGQQFDEFVIQHLDENRLRLAMDTPTSGVALVARP